MEVGLPESNEAAIVPLGEGWVSVRVAAPLGGPTDWSAEDLGRLIVQLEGAAKWSRQMPSRPKLAMLPRWIGALARGMSFDGVYHVRICSADGGAVALSPDEAFQLAVEADHLLRKSKGFLP